MKMSLFDIFLLSDDSLLKAQSSLLAEEERDHMNHLGKENHKALLEQLAITVL